MSEVATKVVVLCGGRGARLGGMTAEIPKPMVLVGGKPILQHIIESYVSKGLRDFVLCVGYRGEIVRRFVEGADMGATIEVSDDGEDASMLRRIHAARQMIGERAIVTYGDTFVDMDPVSVLASHAASGAPLTMMVADIRSPFGIVETDPCGRVRFFREKPVFNYYIGLMVIERSLLDGLDEQLLAAPDGEGLVELFGRLIEQDALNAHRYDGPQITFNTPDEHVAAEKELMRFFTEQEGR